jgi:hypothetical protein
MAIAIGVFFRCANFKFSSSTLEYMIKAILVHLDDQNEKVQRAIFDCLKVAADIDPALLIKEVYTSSMLGINYGKKF